MAADQVIYKLIPYAVPKPWGGGHLDALAANQAAQKIGEYVLFSNLPQFPVRIEVSGSAILLADFWRDQYGPERAIPFMLKVLSTAEPISVQNHPSDSDVISLGLTGRGKLEAWTILEASPEARMYLGLKEDQPPGILRQLGELANPLSVFHEFKPKQGEVVTLNPGLVHSTTGTMLFYEIQQMSDYTFRIYDFDRGRPLNLDEAIHCLHAQEPAIADFSSDLVSESFSVSYHSPTTGLIALRSQTASVITWFGRSAVLSVAGTEFPVRWGDSFFLPDAAARAVVITPSGGASDNNLPMIDMLFEAHL